MIRFLFTLVLCICIVGCRSKQPFVEVTPHHIKPAERMLYLPSNCILQQIDVIRLTIEATVYGLSKKFTTKQMSIVYSIIQKLKHDITEMSIPSSNTVLVELRKQLEKTFTTTEEQLLIKKFISGIQESAENTGMVPVIISLHVSPEEYFVVEYTLFWLLESVAQYIH